ncbi:MAG TPA: hypothetical protein VMT00_04470 [Thermoanaerobaculia bacterium]|nr:hypothetical protein [Thermoanaerobaculia bacterium]
MTKTLFATFDGEVLRLEEPVELAPNTRVRVTIESTAPNDSASGSFLRTAQALNLEGPPDWSARIDEYLYGEVESGG